MSDNIIKIEAKHAYTMFPKKPTILGTEDNTYGIVSWNVINIIEGNPNTDKYDNITVTGVYEEIINFNKIYTILAKEVDHEKYGKQYQLIFIGEVLDLGSVSNQKYFLKTFLTDGQIEEMFKVLKNPLETIQKHDIESLKKVHGIGDYISQRIIERFEEGKDYCNVYLELDGLGLTPLFIQKLIKKYQNPNKIIKIIKENPYQLSFDIEGIGFKTADKIAIDNGMNPKSKERIKGYINYLLQDLGECGDSFISANELRDFIFADVGDRDEILELYYNEDGKVIGNNISEAINDLEMEGLLVLEKEVENASKSQRRVYLTRYWELEQSVGRELKRIAKTENNFEFEDWKDSIKSEEEKQGWCFTEQQVEGIEGCLNNQIVFITGVAGTGKTSVLTGALKALRCYENKYSFAQTSLSGRAAARMSEVTGAEGFTIHRLLGFKPPNGFACNELNPLSYDIIILDEISLVGGDIFLFLLKAIQDGSKLIILGDMGQLESIGCMNLAQDLYKSKFIKTIELNKIHRQAQKSGIIVASKSIREGIPLFDRNFVGTLTLGELQDMHFDISSKKDDTRDKVVDYFEEYWNSDLVDNIMDIQILSPVKDRGEASVYNINLDIQDMINPPEKNKKEIELENSTEYSKGKTFCLREGDKVMNLKNNYKLENVDGVVVEVFNGWVGLLEKIDDVFQKAIIYFPNIKDRIIFPYSELKKSVVLSYASTIHKYQGSSAKVIIGVLDYSTPPNMRTKELLYTLLTRAEKECVLIGQNKAIDDAIQTSGVSNKNTFLQEILDQE